MLSRSQVTHLGTFRALGGHSESDNAREPYVKCMQFRAGKIHVKTLWLVYPPILLQIVTSID